MAAFPRFDPLEYGPRRKAGRRLVLLSIALHLALFVLFRDALLGAETEQEDTVIVRMLEEKEPEPEPQKLGARFSPSGVSTPA